MRPRRSSGVVVRPLNFAVRRLRPVPSPYLIAYFAAAAMGLVYLVLLHFLFERLASRHVSTWEGLGSPAFFSSMNFGTVFRVLRFLLRRDYLGLNDPVAARLASSALVLLIAVVLICTYVQVVFYANGGRWPQPSNNRWRGP